MAPRNEQLFGIHEVYNPPGGNADVDIVAVHGLGGHATKTWTDSQSNICWLNHPDFLPKHIANARVLVWGYNASFSSLSGTPPSKDRVMQHAQTLVAQLYADRSLEKREDKPIIFLCHSLGGIIVKRALSYSNSRTSNKISHIHSIATCTYGLLFFGTPHNGSTKAHLLRTMQKLAKVTIPRSLVDNESNLLRTLEHESETLQNINDHFVPLMKKYCIYFFWEQDKTDLKVDRDYIVTESSAAPIFDDTERAGIAADHINMVKFASNRASGFRIVAAALDKYCQEAPGVVDRKCRAAKQELEEDRKNEAKEIIYRIQGSGGVSQGWTTTLGPIESGGDLETQQGFTIHPRLEDCAERVQARRV